MKILNEYKTQHPNLNLLPYVIQLLLAAKTEEESLERTQALWEDQENLGYHATAKKTQFC